MSGSAGTAPSVEDVLQVTVTEPGKGRTGTSWPSSGRPCGGSPPTAEPAPAPGTAEGREAIRGLLKG